MNEFNWWLAGCVFFAIMFVNYVIVPWAVRLGMDARETRKSRTR